MNTVPHTLQHILFNSHSVPVHCRSQRQHSVQRSSTIPSFQRYSQGLSSQLRLSFFTSLVFTLQAQDLARSLVCLLPVHCREPQFHLFNLSSIPPYGVHSWRMERRPYSIRIELHKKPLFACVHSACYMLFTHGANLKYLLLYSMYTCLRRVLAQRSCGPRLTCSIPPH